ncbi:MAG: class I SAM-dependent methyltransferase [Nanoarchaeota archaeon]
MERTLEKEVMDTWANALAYASADFSVPHQEFADQLAADYGPYLKDILDLGCGAADIPIRLAKAVPSCRIIGVDASVTMIKLGRKAIKEAELENKINLIRGYIPGLPFKEHGYDAVISNSLLHHLPNPKVFWEEVKRLARDESAIYVKDLLRPKSKYDAKALVEKYAADTQEVHQTDFYNSLLASFTVDEVRKQVKQACLDLKVEQVSDRHWLAKGVLR